MTPTKRTILPTFLALALIALPTISARAQVSNRPSPMPGNGTTQPGMDQPGADQSANMQRMADQSFVQDAGQGGLAEVQFGQLATERASSPAVKQFGQRMVDDHTKANDQLKQIAEKKNIALPTKLSSKDRKAEERLSKLSGADFDRAYMSMMVKDHQKDVSDFRKESANGQDPDIKQFATSTLPTLQYHLKQAESIAPGGTMSQNASPTGQSQ